MGGQRIAKGELEDAERRIVRRSEVSLGVDVVPNVVWRLQLYGRREMSCMSDDCYEVSSSNFTWSMFPGALWCWFA